MNCLQGSLWFFFGINSADIRFARETITAGVENTRGWNLTAKRPKMGDIGSEEGFCSNTWQVLYVKEQK